MVTVHQSYKSMHTLNSPQAFQQVGKYPFQELRGSELSSRLLGWSLLPESSAYLRLSLSNPYSYMFLEWEGSSNQSNQFRGLPEFF